MIDKQTILDLRENCECSKASYCPLEIFVLNHGSDRLYKQHKIVEILKWELSYQAGKDIGWEEAYKDYVKSGLARIFAETYKEGMKNKEILSKMREKYKLLKK